MLRSDERENYAFFDSPHCLPSAEFVLVKEETVSRNIGYEIWLNEPLSVKKRRGDFLHGMGFLGFANSTELMEPERVKGCSKAVSNSSVSTVNVLEENYVSCMMEMNGEANSVVDDLENLIVDGKYAGLSPSQLECEQREPQTQMDECRSIKVSKKQIRSWWKCFIEKKRRGRTCISEVERNPILEMPKLKEVEVWQRKKRFMEFSALYTRQEIQAHKGSIWTLKFSPDGQYLATGGEDGIVRIWRVISTDSSCKYFTPEDCSRCKINQQKSASRGKKSGQGPAVIPDKVFRIEESPLQELHGHESDILDLAWSNSKTLISSSKDKTVCLWQVGCNQCLHVFHHNNYVTCIQFNPCDENCFISGSIDGKARIWGISEKRVVDWADVRDVITAICYQPEGKGFAVGSINGTCRFYEESGKHFQLAYQLYIHGRRKIQSNKITGIQFSQEKPQRVMITSEDSKLHIFDGTAVVHKYKGLPKSGSQMSASLTSDGKHIISIDEDSHVYIWNYDNTCSPSSKHTKSTCSCEHFFSDGVSVAIPWSGIGTEERNIDYDNLRYKIRNSDPFCFSSWFSTDIPSRRSSTWPEEKLPLLNLPVSDDEHCYLHLEEHQQQQQYAALSETWGLVIVTAGLDGTIRTFHNYGLPIRL